jgi:hypothetical protein
MTTKEEIAKEIMLFAEEHYNEGWDFIVECYSIADIVNEMTERNFTTKKQMLDAFGITRDWREDQIADAKNSAF